jgi:hypothetical protein
LRATAKVDQPFRRLDQSRQQIGRQHIDGEKVRQAVGGLDAARLAVADADIVDDRVMRPQRIHLVGDAAHLRDDRDVADHDRVGLRQGAARIGGAGFAARMQRYAMAPFGEQLPRHQAEAFRRTANKDASHGMFIGILSVPIIPLRNPAPEH